MGKDIRIKELTNLLKEIVDYKGEIQWDTSKPDGTPKKLLDVKRMDKLGWKAKVGLEARIQMVYQYYEKD